MGELGDNWPRGGPDEGTGWRSDAAAHRARPPGGRCPVTASEVADRAAASYRARYGADPDGVWFAPGRVNRIGEHTDYSGGFVLPFALRSGVAVAAGRAPGGAITVWSGQEPGDPRDAAVDLLMPGLVSGWPAYPLGMAWSLREAGHRPGGTRFAIEADLAMGAGLSSSAALECATALALSELHGLRVPRPELAALASRAENDFAGAPTGIMDQSAALLCRAGSALLLDCRSGDTEEVPLDPGSAGLALLVCDTGTRHALTDGRYAQRRRSCEEAARLLGASSLRDVTDRGGDVGRLADPELRRRARHVITENRRVLATAAMLRRGALAEAGPLLTQSHASLRDDFEVSWSQADVAVQAALSAGAAGARMLGGGFGGSVLVLARADEGNEVEAAIAAQYARRRWPAPAVSVAVPSDGARR
ncbi:MAG: galactokinase, partial [Streptosporangiaceae bacterium]